MRSAYGSVMPFVLFRPRRGMVTAAAVAANARPEMMVDFMADGRLLRKSVTTRQRRVEVPNLEIWETR
jgi:hypothetical protein